MKTTPRPFRLVDPMALVAATAMGFALDRWRATEIVLPTGYQGAGIGASHWLHVLAFGRPSCFVIALALVLIPLRWMRPRPPATRVIRQPGAVACLAIMGTIAANVAFLLLNGAVDAAMRGPDSPKTIYSNWYYWSKAVDLIPMAVGGAWAALALGGRWSPERSWIDRAGIAVGLYWLASYFLWFFSAIISFFLPYP